MPRADCADRGLTAVAATHHRTTPWTPAAVEEEHIADVIADLLHLAEAAGIDPDAALDHGRRYYDGDLEGALP